MNKKINFLAKSLLVSLIFLCIPNFLKAQPEYWQRIYGGQNSADTYFYDIKNSGTSNYIVTGYTELFDPYRYGLYLLKINNFGLPIWNKIITTGSGYSMVKKNENYIIVGASDSLFCLEIDSSGSVIWLKKYYPRDNRLFNLIKTNDNGYAACGEININQGFVVKFDSSGNLLWNKTYSSGYFRNFTKILEVNNNFYLTGIRRDSANELVNPVITKLNSEGDMIDEKKYSFLNLNILFKDLVFKNNIINIFCDRLAADSRSRNFIVKVDFNLNLVDTLTIQNPNFNLYRDDFERMIPYKENKYILQSFLGDSNQNDFKLLDSNFHLLNYKIVPTYTGLLGLFVAPDNSILSVGTYYGPKFEPDYGYINKMDSNFNTSSNVISVKEYKLVLKDFSLSQNFPNPFNPSTKISYSIKKSSDIELKLFDVLGRFVKLIQSGFKPAGNYEINFTSEGLSSGVYFISMFSDGIFADTKKAVLLK